MVVLLVYLGVGIGLLLLGILLYVLAVSSRRSYVCPECGERMRMEHGTASRCNVCGTPFQEE